MKFVDAHAHLTFEVSDELAPMLQRASEAHISSIINICSDLADLTRGLELSQSQKAPKIFTVAGRTPHDAAKVAAPFFEKVAECARQGKLIAIGETGLDYFYLHASKEVQGQVFIRHLELASQTHLPVVIHCRDAFDDLEKAIQEVAPNVAVMLHCFTGTLEEAKRAIDHGWYISLSGIVTFPKSAALQEVAKFVPKEKLLIETDSPYLAPQGFRGKKNEPAFLVQTAKYIASLRGETVENLGAQTAKNVERLFHVVS
jgi:TatD DNase family protein